MALKFRTSHHTVKYFYVFVNCWLLLFSVDLSSVLQELRPVNRITWFLSPIKCTKTPTVAKMSYTCTFICNLFLFILFIFTFVTRFNKGSSKINKFKKKIIFWELFHGSGFVGLKGEPTTDGAHRTESLRTSGWVCWILQTHSSICSEMQWSRNSTFDGFLCCLEYEKSLWLTLIYLFFAFKESDCLVTIIYLFIKSSLTIILQTLEMLSTVCIGGGGVPTHFQSSPCVWTFSFSLFIYSAD